MAVRYEDQCVGCPPERGCLGNSCRYKNVPIWYCDKCGDEDVNLYEVDGMELCEYCAIHMLPIVHREGI